MVLCVRLTFINPVRDEYPFVDLVWHTCVTTINEDCIVTCTTSIPYTISIKVCLVRVGSIGTVIFIVRDFVPIKVYIFISAYVHFLDQVAIAIFHAVIALKIGGDSKKHRIVVTGIDASRFSPKMIIAILRVSKHRIFRHVATIVCTEKGIPTASAATTIRNI